MRRGLLFALIAMTGSILSLSLWGQPQPSEEGEENEDVPEASRNCVRCHNRPGQGAGIVSQWRDSGHADYGVACVDCHQADASRPDAVEHHGATIVAVVTPGACQECHPEEVAQFSASRHARGADFVGSLDNMLGEVVEGAAAATSGCQQCHGSTVAVREDGSLDPATWPNTGIGRVNPDGTTGSCSGCHTRHAFSSRQARMPENCGRCHMGPDHPHIEIFNESKHGIAFAAWRDSDAMNLDASEWVVGRDYTAAPTCATCHMSATPTQEITHDAGARISWTLRPVVSTHLEDWEARRDSMQDVCTQCHGEGFVDNFYVQFDEAVTLYNTKFAEPAQEIMTALQERELITATPFDDPIEWVFFELWHHQGRRARMGASMMGPDYTQWHGFYEVAQTFYLELLPMVEELGAGDLVEEVLSRDEHRWRQGLSREEIEAQIQFYRQRYGQ